MNDLLEKFEAERKGIFKNNVIYGVVAGVAIALSFFLTYAIEFPVAFVGIPVAIVMVILIVNNTSKFKVKVKDSIVPGMIKNLLGEDAVYEKENGLSLDDALAIGIYRYPDRYNLSDYIGACYNGVPYEMCDVTLEERHVTHDSKGNRHVHYDTYYKGRVIKIDFQRSLDFVVKIIEGRHFSLFERDFQKVETEVIEFNDKFDVFSTNKEKAFYLLTPALIRKMLELEAMYRGSMNFYIDGNYFYVYINDSIDALEVSVSTPIDSKTLDVIRSQIEIGSAIINEFGLDSDKFNENF